jgi:hypothetical protein
VTKSDPHDLHVFMAQVSAEMASEYERIYKKAAGDPGTAGDEGEENWATLLRDWLPPNYHVETKGQLIAPDGSLSPQVDVLVLKPSYPRKLREKKVWLAGGVAAAFECKTTVTARHVTEAVERCARFKSLYAPRHGSPLKELRSPLIYGLIAHSHSWKGEKSDPVGNIERSLATAESAVTHPRLQLDLLCAADLATWSAAHITMYEAKWNPGQQAHLERAFEGPFGPMTSLTCSARETPSQTSEFQPVGAFISILTQQLAWEDASLRDIADYYRLADLWGSAAGDMRPWASSVYSDGVRAQLVAGRGTNGQAWDEWSISLI